jgi:glucose-1-phosphatase
LNLAFEHADTLIFDLGGVILNLDIEGALGRITALMSRPTTDLEETHRYYPFLRQLELGRIDEASFRNSFRAMMREPISDDEIDALWNSMLLDIPAGRIRWLDSLRPQFRMVLLSNTNSIHIRRVDEMIRSISGYRQLTDLFDHTFYSYEINERKPDAACFLHVLDALGLQPRQAVLLDDTAANIETAAQLNMHTVFVPQNSLNPDTWSH